MGAQAFEVPSYAMSAELSLRRRKVTAAALEKAVAGLAHEIYKLEADINGTFISCEASVSSDTPC